MEELFSEVFDFNGLVKVIDSIKSLAESLINLFGTTFSWLGTGILTAIGIGVGIAIVLRIVGR